MSTGLTVRIARQGSLRVAIDGQTRRSGPDRGQVQVNGLPSPPTREVRWPGCVRRSRCSMQVDVVVNAATSSPVWSGPIALERARPSRPRSSQRQAPCAALWAPGLAWARQLRGRRDGADVEAFRCRESHPWAVDWPLTPGLQRGEHPAVTFSFVDCSAGRWTWRRRTTTSWRSMTTSIARSVSLRPMSRIN